MNLNKNFEDLYQVLGVKSSEVTYPYCSNCFKKVFYLNHKKKWNCTSCKEEFNQVCHRYKLCLEITNLKNLKCVTAFGKQLEILFGIDSNKFYRFKHKKFNDSQSWLYCLENAFNYCLIGRWLYFDLKELKEGLIVNNIRIPNCETEYFIPVFNFLSKKSDIDFSSSFNADIECENNSIINETLDEETNEICSFVENMQIKSVKTAQTVSTPLYKKFRKLKALKRIPSEGN